MVKLTKHQPSPSQTVIRVDGRLDARAVGEFRGLLESLPAAASIAVDLQGLTSVDPDGLAFLISLRETGCRLLGGSMYINKLLEEV